MSGSSRRAGAFCELCVEALQGGFEIVEHCIEAAPERGTSPDEHIVAVRAREQGACHEVAQTAADALAQITALAKGDDRAPRILIGGSLYFAGNILEENGTPPD